MEKHIRLIRDIFTHYGMETEADTAEGYDFSAADDKYDYVVAVKMPKNPTVGILQLEPIIRDLIRAAEREEKTPILVIGAVMRKQRKALKRYEDLVLIDIQNLLYMVQNRHDQKLQLLSALEYSVDLLLPEKPDLAVVAPIFLTSPDEPGFDDSDELRARNRLDGLITLLSDWDRASTASTDYEDVCCNVLKRLFADDLALWQAQKKSNDGLFRFDLICKIKNGNDKEFWRMAERYFGSKYIVFEFKNYSGMVGQREIFTTVKYLYSKALRGVAIIISTNGTDDHGDRAIRGILRDEGKLILSLSNQDLVQMLKMKRRNDDPAEYLSEKLDALLIDLEK